MEENKSTTPQEAPAPAPAAPRQAPSGEGRSYGPRNGGPRRGGRFSGPRPPRTCPFCKQKLKSIDYKQADVLRRFLTDHGKIKARRKVGTCARHQRMLAVAIKRARHVALLPFTTESTRGE